MLRFVKKYSAKTDRAILSSPSLPVSINGIGGWRRIEERLNSLLYRYIFLILFIFIVPIALTSCQSAPPPTKTCQACHAIIFDKNHSLACHLCHGGVSPAADERAAHQEMIARPAAPGHWREGCGGCHEKEVSAVQQSSHLTLDGYQRLRHRYGGKPVSGIDHIPIYSEPKTTAELADDLLRRRCLRCHLFYAGEDYAASKHGLGCAACHMRRQNGKMTSHQFAAPSDQECLACHYGNRVGADYYGLFQHDLPPDYATPFPPAAEPAFGIESHQLIPDIHQRRGLACIDCHRGGELMATDDGKASCAVCHDPALLATRLPTGVSKKDGGFLFTSHDGAVHPLPTLRHPAHEQYGKSVSCQVCHAQWAFDDDGLYAIRIDHDDWQEWRPLMRQGITELDHLLQDVFLSGKNPGPAVMSDPFTGERRPGFWLLAYGQRRWENIRTARIAGKLVVV
ncbi:MAG: hypothetical protein LBH14_02045, partial [Desulfobulbaceae bacterium]|nr:hypothetical protein [Desulfobulbaceae bacterium]